MEEAEEGWRVGREEEGLLQSATVSFSSRLQAAGTWTLTKR